MDLLSLALGVVLGGIVVSIAVGALAFFFLKTGGSTSSPSNHQTTPSGTPPPMVPSTTPSKKHKPHHPRVRPTKQPRLQNSSPAIMVTSSSGLRRRVGFSKGDSEDLPSDGSDHSSRMGAGKIDATDTRRRMFEKSVVLGTGHTSAVEFDLLEKHFIDGVHELLSSSGGGEKRKLFSGYDAVTWLMEHIEHAERNDALTCGLRLWAKGLFRSVDSSWIPLRDQYDAYYYIVDQRKREHKMVGKSSVKKAMYAEKKQNMFKPTRKEGWLEVQEMYAHSDATFKPHWVTRWAVLYHSGEENLEMVSSVRSLGVASGSTGRIRSSSMNSSRNSTTSTIDVDVDDEDDDEEDEDSSDEDKDREDDKQSSSQLHHDLLTATSEIDASHLSSMVDDEKRGWYLLLFDAMWDERDSKLVMAMIDRKNGLPLQKRSWYKSRHNRVFKGSGAVRWVLQHKEASTESEAVLLLNRLLERKIISPKGKRTRKAHKKSPFFINSTSAVYRFSKLCFYGGTAQPHPLVRMNLRKCSLSMDNTEDHVMLILNGRGGTRSIRDVSGLSGRHRVDTSGTELILGAVKSDQSVIRDWVAALNAALLDDGSNAWATSHIVDDDEMDDPESFTKTLKDETRRRQRKSTDMSAFDESMEMNAFGGELLQAELIKVEEVRGVLRAQLDAGECAVDESTLSDEFILQCLRARTLDIQRAAISVVQYSEFLDSYHFHSIAFHEARPVLEHMLYADFTLRDREGRPYVVVSAKNYLPKRYAAPDVLRGMVYLLDIGNKELADSAMVQRIGFTLVFDLTGMSLRKNFDAKALSLIVHALLSCYPMSIGDVLVLNAPWGFGAIWKMVKGLVPKTIQERTHMLKMAEVKEYIEEQNLFCSLGGAAKLDQETWIREREEREETQQRETELTDSAATTVLRM